MSRVAKPGLCHFQRERQREDIFYLPLIPGQNSLRQFPTPRPEGLDLSRGLPGGWQYFNIEMLKYCYRPWNGYVFHCHFRQGCNCVKQIPNYAVKAIVTPYDFNFKVFLSEDILVQIMCFKLLSKM